MFNTSIYRQPGGSEMTVGAAGSLNVAGKLNLTGTLGGNLSLEAGTCVTPRVSGAENGTVQIISTSLINAFISAGREAPVHSASPGSLYVRSDGSMSAWYFNISTGAGGSVWRSAASG